MTKTNTNPETYTQPLTVNDLNGRVLHLPATQPRTTRNILFIYGQHSSLERWWGLLQNLSQYGHVTAPDIPGYGGMDSLYKVGKKPSFDELADYLAAFIEQYYTKGERLTIMGLSIGFAEVTRMLQRHPQLIAQVDNLISVVGFAHHNDFIFTKRRQRMYTLGCRVFNHWPLYLFLRYCVFNPRLMYRYYARTFNAREKFEGLSGDEFSRTMEMELELWRLNDIRTWMYGSTEMFHLDNTQVKIPLPVYHLFVRKDRYFHPVEVERHYRQIFKSYHAFELPTDTHAPSVIATPEEASLLIPPELVKALA